MTEERPSPSGVERVIPQATVTRLATYLRVLSILADEGVLIVSSEELATAAGVGSAKLRKDLSFLGPNGVRGVGYDVARLRAKIDSALGLDRGHRVVLAGVGNLGQALAGYGGFARRGFTMVGLFDNDPARVGIDIDGLTVRHVDELVVACRELEATIGVIATPDESVHSVAEQLVSGGVESILSFSPMVLDVPEHVEVRRVDLAVEMQVLSFNSSRNVSGPTDIDGPAIVTAPRPQPVSPPPLTSTARLGRSHGPRIAGNPSPVNSSTRNGSVIAP
ncbi:redox-sensing transcriptional repressor Rex [Rhodococcus sp. 15-725-2-2b]|uniref:redox-sensing transcriptional repressor Rex n=1 Tax=Nocardiaceae TaxID=85025 RepID=UPI00050C475D|nr:MULTISPECIES: redox-sensing transcriptional repressor Rex [Rhodococcus]OZC56846.1 redox-sensing transcriptional repressor Rex [Rhodococcus sp. 06-470-2]OZC68499.1 redox-sensing transcriptional repressor Rex [Rhodococcus sp. 06-469-3-2]OZD45177.1 redox-sensing transcriptional repressor Rex [Rhodococcus sp. 06-1477-1A]OZD83878.1 redox-sensing transcriptional repressor Rex [Rhodococcus sp. 05-339-2]OZE65531.1 redox-sensing transcriptional repressor Rex [Rhodococcus sp. 05-2221-1B]